MGACPREVSLLLIMIRAIVVRVARIYSDPPQNTYGQHPRRNFCVLRWEDTGITEEKGEAPYPQECMSFSLRGIRQAVGTAFRKPV